jgi:hypothetical protein
MKYQDLRDPGPGVGELNGQIAESIAANRANRDAAAH